MNKFGFNQKYLDNMVDILKQDENVVCAKIFGSRAVGDYKYNSDIDMAIYFKDGHEKSIKTIFNLEDSAGLYKVDVVVVNDLLDEKFRHDIEKYGIEIYRK